jgi:hypothetical protein
LREAGLYPVHESDMHRKFEADGGSSRTGAFALPIRRGFKAEA